LATFFRGTSYVLFFYKNWLGFILGDFFTKSSGRLGEIGLRLLTTHNTPPLHVYLKRVLADKQVLNRVESNFTYSRVSYVGLKTRVARWFVCWVNFGGLRLENIDMFYGHF
jgi:hypothetical protein